MIRWLGRRSVWHTGSIAFAFCFLIPFFTSGIVHVYLQVGKQEFIRRMGSSQHIHCTIITQTVASDGACSLYQSYWHIITHATYIMINIHCLLHLLQLPTYHPLLSCPRDLPLSSLEPIFPCSHAPMARIRSLFRHSRKVNPSINQLTTSGK